MDRIFVPIYRFFARRRGLMYAVLILSAAIFVFFGLKLKYEEDISKLVPNSGSGESALAFGNLRVKDKIFIQITEDGAGPDMLGGYVDEFMDSLLLADSSSRYISDALYRIDEDDIMNVLDFALTHVPSFVDTSCYAAFDGALADLDTRMAENFDLVMEDMTGSATQMVATDPLGLRSLILERPDMGYSFVDGHIFCADSSVVLAFISPDFSSMDSGSGTRLSDRIDERVSAFSQAHPDAKVYVHGAPIRAVWNSRTIKHDLLWTVGLSLLVILFFICLSFKSGDVLWQLVLPVLYGTFFALACMYWLKGGMSLMALGIGAIVLGVALSYCLHVIVHHRFVGDAEKMLRDESTPVCLGCITTIGAFLGLLFTSSDLLRDFGLFASFALAGATVFALVFLPHFLKEGDVRRNRAVFSFIDKANGFPYDRNVPLLIAVCAVIAVGLAFTPKVKFDTDLRNLGYIPGQLADAEALYAEKNTHGELQRYYAAAAPTLDEALKADAAVSAVLDSLKNAGAVDRVSAPVSALFIPLDAQQERIDAWNAYWNPEKKARVLAAVRRSAAAHGLDPDMFGPFEAMISASYEPESLYDAGVLPAGLVSNFIEESGDRFLVFNSALLPASARETADRAVASRPHALVVDPFFYTNDMVRIIHDDFNVILGISSLFVFLVMLISFRSLLISVISFLPMFFSWYIVQGLMAIFGIEFNLINIVVSSFIFGVGVDYSIFVMEGLLSGARTGRDDILEWHKSAIFFSAAVLIVVVVSLLFARHPAISSIGVSTLIGMVSTILITYTLQPFLFRQALKVRFFRNRITGTR